VSVVIPVFNRPVAVRRAVQSVLAQTFHNFEIVVVDDGSTDETAESVSSFQDPRIKLIRHGGKRGGSAARNTGIRSSSAPYIAFLDSDDEWLPAKLQRQLELFERSDEKLALVYTGTQRIFDDGRIRGIIARRHSDLELRLLTHNVVGETSVGMVRRSALDAIGVFDETLPALQDLDLWLRLCEQFEAGVVPDILVRVAKGDDGGRITTNSAATTRARDLFCEKHADKLRRRNVLHRYLRSTAWVYLRVARDPIMARRRYLDSVAARPTAIFTYLMLGVAWLPMAWLDTLATWKRNCRAVLRWIGADGRRSMPIRTSHNSTL
jgi:glycosyltransferase involved in cell wall biosynthesis